MKLKRLISLGLISLSMLSALIVAQKSNTAKAGIENLTYNKDLCYIQGESSAVDATSTTSFRTIGCSLYNKETQIVVNLWRQTDGSDSNNVNNRYSGPGTAKYYRLKNTIRKGTKTTLDVTHIIDFGKILEDNLFGEDFEHLFKTARSTTFIYLLLLFNLFKTGTA